MMNSISIRLLAGIFLAFSLHAAAAGKPWVSAKTGVMSEYLGANGAVFYDSPVSVSEFDIGRGDWYGGIWNSTGLGGTPYGRTYGDEFDAYCGWAHVFDWIRLDLSSSYYAISRLGRMNDDQWVVEPEVSFPKCPFAQPYIRCRYYNLVGSQSPSSGVLLLSGFKKDIVLGVWTAGRTGVLSLKASTAYSARVPSKTTGFVYGRLTSSLDVPLAKNWTLSPVLIFQVAARGQRGAPDDFTDGRKFVYGVNLAWTY